MRKGRGFGIPRMAGFDQLSFTMRTMGAFRVRLDLAPGASIFVVFSEFAPASLAGTEVFHSFENGRYALTGDSGRTKTVDINDLPAPLTLKGPWTVAFDPEWGAPAKVALPELMSWTDHEYEGVKYYSGSGCYTRTLDIPGDWLASERSVHLDLGDVRDLAEVFVNGESVGILWKPPFRVDITAFVRPGLNDLKIEVMNLWCQPSDRRSGPAPRKTIHPHQYSIRRVPRQTGNLECPAGGIAGADPAGAVRGGYG